MITRFPELKRVRYTTMRYNEASLRLAASVGMREKYSWGVILKSQAKAVDSGSGDNVTYEQITLGAYRTRVLEALESTADILATDIIKLVNDGSSLLGSPEDVMAVHQMGTAPKPLLIFDWKAVEFTRKNLDTLIKVCTRSRGHLLPMLSSQYVLFFYRAMPS